MPEADALLHVTRGDGLITRDQAAALCQVQPVTISQWVRRGHLQPAKHEGGRVLFDPVAVARAEHATRKRARRVLYAN